MSDLCPDCGLPNPDTNPYCFCKPMRLNRGGESGSQDQGAHQKNPQRAAASPISTGRPAG